jgi:CMP/dCMP kinase
MIVTIDGPAGAGKSSIAKQAADAVGFEFLDTGAMYRAVALAAIRAQIEFDDRPGLVHIARTCRLEPEGDRIRINGEDVSAEIRSPTVTSAVKFVADVLEIRHELVRQQRQFAFGRSVVSEGRDQGTDVFPDAQCKIFLTASPEERARRRWTQLAQEGRAIAYEDILEAQNRRDSEDASRPYGALRIATDARILTTDGMSPVEVLQATITIIREAVERVAANA